MSGPAQETNSEPNYEVEAKEMGWSDKDQWRGDPEKWVDAKTFVERGEHFLPMLRAERKRLKQDLLTRDSEITTLKQTQATMEKTLGALKKHYDESVKLQVAQGKKELAAQIKQAREDGDTDLELQLLDQLSDVRQLEKEAIAEAKEENRDPPVTKTQAQVEFEQWNKENTWFGGESKEDQRRTQLVIRAGQDLRWEGDTTVGNEFMEKCLARVAADEGKGGSSKRPVSKVESGDGRARSSGGRAFDALPKEAKDICHSDNDKFVGPGKMFEKVKDWEDHFAKMIEEQG
jgi:hypothetical protein